MHCAKQPSQLKWCNLRMVTRGTMCKWHLAIFRQVHMWEKIPSTYTTSRHTFYHQTIAVHINKQFSQILMLKVSQATLAVACFWGLSDVHECLGLLSMAPSPLDKQTASCNSPNNWLISLAMDLAAFCDMLKSQWHQWMSFGCL